MTTIPAGTTTTQSGSISLSGTLEIDGGPGSTNGTIAPGGTYDNTGTVTSSAIILIDAGDASGGSSEPGGAGGRLVNTGLLTNSGTIFVIGSASAFGPGAAGSLQNNGAFVNNGTIQIDGGAGSPGSGEGYSSGAATLVSTVTFLNAGLVIVTAGGDGGYGQDVPAGAGSTLTDSGVFTNTGTLLIATGGHYNGPPAGGGASMTESGTLINAGSLDVAGTFGNSGNLSVSGTLTDTGTFTVEGTVTVGLLDIGAGGLVSVSGRTPSAIQGRLSFSTATMHGGAELDILGGGSASGTIDFTSPARLEVVPGAYTGLTLAGLNDGAMIQANGANITSAQIVGKTLSIATTASGTITFTVAAGTTGSVFTISQGTDGFNDLLTVNCFLAGTHILTPQGEIAVETLRIGDLVVAGGDRPRQAAIRWIGRREIDLARHDRPELVRPIRVRTHAFGNWLPHRDLLLSPDHAVQVQGHLIPIRLLVNHTTIAPDHTRQHAAYFHVELDRHDILFAEGLAAESYLDTGNRSAFINAGQPTMLHPVFTNAVLTLSPDIVEPIWRELADRAVELGHVAPPANGTPGDPALRLLVDGHEMSPTRVIGRRSRFMLASPTRLVRLLSRSAWPSESAPWLDDRRNLGVAIRRITLRRHGQMFDLPLDHPNLAAGWWTIEGPPTAPWRWTDGHAELRLPEGVDMLEIDLNDHCASGTALPTVIARSACDVMRSTRLRHEAIHGLSSHGLLPRKRSSQ